MIDRLHTLFPDLPPVASLEPLGDGLSSNVYLVKRSAIM